MGNPALRSRTSAFQVKEIKHASTKEMVSKMINTMYDSKIGCGLAGPQVGIGRQVFVIGDQNPDQFIPTIPLFNPRIVKTEGTFGAWEACLSIPNLIGRVHRHAVVHVDYLDEEGRNQRLRATGFKAALMQHEIDHLQGVLFPDRMSKEELERYFLFREEFEARAEELVGEEELDFGDLNLL
eukprot:TRINITY_DN7125_c0_g1_i1.p1 TRINITY_DN7125_c0_g1~~TRINITY_DN7125_c0_g1_i1.p1  ORF type:complete len:189 (-),score=39.95 TRINITY_DN7125_c0_g1_i1:41-586(-)